MHVPGVCDSRPHAAPADAAHGPSYLLNVKRGRLLPHRQLEQASQNTTMCQIIIVSINQIYNLSAYLNTCEENKNLKGAKQTKLVLWLVSKTCYDTSCKLNLTN